MGMMRSLLVGVKGGAGGLNYVASLRNATTIHEKAKCTLMILPAFLLLVVKCAGGVVKEMALEALGVVGGLREFLKVRLERAAGAQRPYN